jgi:PilZ domain
LQERRKHPRLRVLKSAKLIFGKASVFDCVVRNLTAVGARIEIPNTIDLPQVFEMTFDGGRSIRSCRLVWRTSSGTGVEFSEIGPSVGLDHESTMQAQQESTTLTPCPKCRSGMIQVAITPHPVAPRMLRHTYVCRACNQTRTYMLPTPPVAEAIYAGTSSRHVDLIVA